MATPPTKKHGTKRLKEPPRSPSAFDDKTLEMARQQNSWLLDQWKTRGSIQKDSTFNKLLKAGCSFADLTLLYLDFLLWRTLDELRPRRAQIVSAHDKLVTAYDALKDISNLDEVPFLLENEFKRRYSVRQRQLLTLGHLKQRIEELELLIIKLPVHRGAPRKVSRDFFMVEFRRRVVPPGRSLDKLASQLYTEYPKTRSLLKTTGVNVTP